MFEGNLALKTDEEEDSSVVPFQKPALTLPTRTKPPTYIWVVYWTDTKEEVKNDQDRNWRAFAVRSTENKAIKFISTRPQEEGISYGYEKFILDEGE